MTDTVKNWTFDQLSGRSVLHHLSCEIGSSTRGSDCKNVEPVLVNLKNGKILRLTFICLGRVSWRVEKYDRNVMELTPKPTTLAEHFQKWPRIHL